MKKGGRWRGGWEVKQAYSDKGKIKAENEDTEKYDIYLEERTKYRMIFFSKLFCTPLKYW